MYGNKIIVVFQPHRYTRTKALFDEFLMAFPNADTLIVTDIYAASEAPIDGINARNLCDAIRNRGHKDVIFISNFNEIVNHLLSIAKPSDVIITQGAGNVWKVGEEYLKRASHM